MLLVKLPMPLPSVVWLPLIVGFADVLQQIPRAVTAAPPVEVTLPPPVAVVAVILVTEAVVMVGKVADVVKLFCSPYVVPLLFVAYART